MKLKKTLSFLLATLLVVSASAVAMAQDTGTTAGDTVQADGNAQATPAVYTLEEMLTMAMTDAYNRQAAYAAYGEAFPDSRSIKNLDLNTQIVLLEMLLKANGVALPAADAEITVPETQPEAYTAIFESETGALQMYRSFLGQEDLAADARIVFRSVAQLVHSDSATFAMRAQTARRAARIQELMKSEDTQVYVINNDKGRGSQVIYMITNRQTTDEDGAAADETTTDTTTEDVAGD